MRSLVCCAALLLAAGAGAESAGADGLPALGIAVAYDGSAAGLSADGRTLILIQPRAGFPRAQTPLMVVDAQRLRILEDVTLHGDFSFDAISPRGSLVYLIEYISPTDTTRYRVRAPMTSPRTG